MPWWTTDDRGTATLAPAAGLAPRDRAYVETRRAALQALLEAERAPELLRAAALPALDRARARRLRQQPDPRRCVRRLHRARARGCGRDERRRVRDDLQRLRQAPVRQALRRGHHDAARAGGRRRR